MVAGLVGRGNLACAVVLLVLPTWLEAAKLKAETLEAWTRYVSMTERRIESELESPHGFLVQDFLPAELAARATASHRDGAVFTAKLRTETPTGRTVRIPKGLVHHWLGSILVPGAKLEPLLEWLKAYDEHHRYFDEVTGSRLVSRSGDSFEISLRLRRKKVITVHYETDHAVRYRRHDRERVSSVSKTTRIAEIQDAGTPSEREKPIGHDRGFLWRLNSYWRLQQTERGVVVEIETLSLSRGVPRAVKWLVSPYLDSVPRESLEATLLPIRARNSVVRAPATSARSIGERRLAEAKGAWHRAARPTRRRESRSLASRSSNTSDSPGRRREALISTRAKVPGTFHNGQPVRTFHNGQSVGDARSAPVRDGRRRIMVPAACRVSPRASR